jgi:hypothetical protein
MEQELSATFSSHQWLDRQTETDMGVKTENAE